MVRLADVQVQVPSPLYTFEGQQRVVNWSRLAGPLCAWDAALWTFILSIQIENIIYHNLEDGLKAN